MKSWLRRSAEWVIALGNRLSGGELLAGVRLKLTFWCAVIGFAALLAMVFSPLRADAAFFAMLMVLLCLAVYGITGIILRPVERAIGRQRRFIADVSHELRTPLSVMRMTSEVTLMEHAAAEGAGGPRDGELTEAIRNNLEEIDRMSKITQFLLDFSDPERRRRTYERIPVDVTEVARSTVKSMAPLADNKNIALGFSEEGEGTHGSAPLVVLGNTTALDEMLANLIKNAITYTPHGGRVNVKVFRRGRRWGDSILISVSDTGVGIPPDDLPNIFEPFYRAKNARKDHHSMNTGLGLAIVKEIADMHGATLGAQSKIGGGTTISVQFPSFSRKVHTE